jgi:fructokinase
MVRSPAVRAACVGGVETGGSKTACAIGSGPEDVRAETSFATTTPAETLGRAVDFFRAHQARMPCAAIGIASFGPLDLDPVSPTLGFLTATPKAAWSHVDVAGTVRRALALPVGIDTDVNAAALAEHRWGAGVGDDPLVYVTVGTGIGGGVVVAGRPLHGLVHPEMGHMRVPRDAGDPFRGTCPFHADCLEGLASGPAILARRGLPAEALPDDDPVWAVEARYLASGLVNVITVLSPRRIVVSGGVMRHPGLLHDVRTEVRRLLAGYVGTPAIVEAIEAYIVAPGLGERAGVLGALALAQDAIGD